MALERKVPAHWSSCNNH